MNYSQYELLKQTWVATHPDSTPQQYQKAMTAIARKCGV